MAEMGTNQSLRPARCQIRAPEIVGLCSELDVNFGLFPFSLFCPVCIVALIEEGACFSLVHSHVINLVRHWEDGIIDSFLAAPRAADGRIND